MSNFCRWMDALGNWSKEVEGVDCPTGKSLPLAVMKYRKHMFDKGCGWAEYSDLETVYKSGDNKRLYDFLQHMFLEIIEYETYEYIMGKLNGDNLRNFYDLHNEDKNARMLNVIIRMS